MEHMFKFLGSHEQARSLWENKEALERYIARLKDFWDEGNQQWLNEAKKPSLKDRTLPY